MMRAILIDDEAKSRKVLKSLLQQFQPDILLCGEAANIEDGFNLIVQHSPDIVFLDVQMPNGNGFDLLRKFEQIDFAILFITGYDHYAVNAIKFNALDYLLKPVDISELNEAIQKAKRYQDLKELRSTSYLNLINDFQGSSLDRKLLIHHSDQVILQPWSKIVSVASEGRYSIVHNEDNQFYMIARTLKEMEEYFSENPSFFRLSKHVIVNLNYITSYSKGEPCFVELQNGQKFETSRRRKQHFLEWIKRK